MRLTVATLVAVLATLVGAPAAFARDDGVTSFDGTKIALHFFPAPQGGKAPTILEGPGWSMSGATDTSSPTDPTLGVVGLAPLLKAGYNVLTWDPRGFGASGGTAQVDSPDAEGRDVQALIDYVARQPEAQLDGPNDPRVGMVGGSYGGGIQLVTAAIDRRVDAMVPDIAWNSLHTALYKDDTVKSGWSAILYAAATAVGARLDPHITSAFTSGTTMGRLSPDDVAWFESRGPGDALINRIRIPTFFIQGTADTLFTLDEALRNHAIVEHNGVPTKMLWFCGGHAACLTDPGDTERIERDTLAWLARYLRGDRSVDTGPGFEWLDQDGRSFSAPNVNLPASTPLTADGCGEIAAIAAPLAATKAQNAVNVPIAAPSKPTLVVGPPQVTLTYSGVAPNADGRVYGQIVDDASGKVLGNQITPIPVTLDGAQHSVTRPLEVVSATTKPGESLTLQIVASTTAYDIQRPGGAVTLSNVHVELPTVDPAKVDAGGGAPPSPAASRPCRPRRSVVVKVARRHRRQLRSAKVTAGRRVLARMHHGHSQARVRIPAGTSAVKIVMRLRGGRTVTVRQRVASCE
jgi:ABC-2 type transport system ATP-binding protein